MILQCNRCPVKCSIDLVGIGGLPPGWARIEFIAGHGLIERLCYCPGCAALFRDHFVQRPEPRP